MKKIYVLTFLILSCARVPDDCSLEFLGTSRRAVKLRTEEDGRYYLKFNGGKPITVSQWYALVGSLDPKVPNDFRRISEKAPMPDIETIEVTLRCWILAYRFEHSDDGSKEKDNDFHIEVGGEPRWDTPHVVVEIPPGSDYCDARRLITDLAREDALKTGHRVKKSVHIFGNPVEALFRGYVFFDKPHAESARKKHEGFSFNNGGRGIQAGGPSRVEGIWEIHPVLSVVTVR